MFGAGLAIAVFIGLVLSSIDEALGVLGIVIVVVAFLGVCIFV